MCPCAGGEVEGSPADVVEDAAEDKAEDAAESDEDKAEREAAVRLAQFREMRAMRRQAAQTTAAAPAEAPAAEVAPVTAPEPKTAESKPEEKEEEKAEEKEEDKGMEKDAAVTWAPLMTPEDMQTRDGRIALDMTLRGADTATPYYVMWLDGHPFGELHLADGNTEEDLHDVFVSDTFVNGVRETVAACGPANTFETLRVRYYAAETKENEAVRKAKAEIAGHADAAYKARAAALKGNLMVTLHLAMEASRKNFILENPLKDSLVENMRKAGMSERVAIDIIEDAFVKSGGEYLKAMVNQADEWLGWEPEALRQIENTVTKMAYVHPLDMAPLVEEDIPSKPVFERAAAVSTDPSLDADTDAALRVVRARKRR
ncbi:MAG: hypothetical protein WC505_06700 [Patescibacteria group bacterium]